MAFYRDQLSLFFVLLLFFSPQIHARQGSFFSRFMRYTSNNNVDVTEPKEPLSPAPAPTSTLSPGLAPEPMEFTPAPTPTVADVGDAYGLYGRDSSRFSTSQETPAVNNELLNEELVGDDSYETGYPKTHLYSNYDHVNPTHHDNDNDNGYYTNSFKNDQYRSDDNENSGSGNNYKGYSYTKVNSNNAFYNNRADSQNSYGRNGYQNSEWQGMSDTRPLGSDKYYYDVKGESNRINVYDESTGKGSTKFGEGYYESNKSPYEFDSMEEYEKQQESEGYVP